MQHPDEGMIHSWLDGALSAEDSAAVESHVAGCQHCATAVAEARGFIAASSRILTALDDVPRGVIPVAPARKRDLRVVWRVAAAMLVVAGGSFIALRDGGPDAGVRLSTTDSVASIAVSASDAKVKTAVPEAGGIEDNANVAQQQSAPVPNQRRTAQAPAIPERSLAASRTAPVNEQDFAGKGVARGARGSAVVGGTGRAVATDLATPPASTLSSVSETGARAESAPLRVVSVERVIGGSRTTYQIAPAQTVTLTETESIALSGVVTSGVQAQRNARAAREAPAMRAQVAGAPSPAPPVADSPRGRDSAARSTEVALARKTMQTLAGSTLANQPNTISWTEAVTGKKLTLSGNLPVERLQEIKLRIERERAASRLKTP